MAWMVKAELIMEEIIKRLKIARLAYIISNECDYCSEDNDLEELVADFPYLNGDLEGSIQANKEFEGWQNYEISNEINRLIDELP